MKKTNIRHEMQKYVICPNNLSSTGKASNNDKFSWYNNQFSVQKYKSALHVNQIIMMFFPVL